MRNLILRDSRLVGWEFGMLRCLEEEILKLTEGAILDVFAHHQPTAFEQRFRHGTRYEALRRWLPKRELKLPDADVLWLVLMGPENYRLDLFRGWERCAKRKVVYLFDTLPGQMSLIKRLFSNPVWDVCATSFSDAVPLLETETRRKWHHMDQAVSLEYFNPPPAEQKPIHFSAYGRRHEGAHQAVVEFCRAKGLYYDFTTHDRSQPTADPLVLFRQYGWHLSHSLFTFCWPLEVTNPGRASGLSPITCRWFEAAAAGAAVIGQTPANPHFRELFGDDFVTPLDPTGDKQSILHQLEMIWQRREALAVRALALRQQLGPALDWSARVRRMLSLVQNHPVQDPCA